MGSFLIFEMSAFIHNGKIIMTASKNELVHSYAVIHCTESQFHKLDTSDMIAYRKRNPQFDVLISNKKEVQRKYKNIVADHVSVDEIFLMLVKGEHV